MAYLKSDFTKVLNCAKKTNGAVRKFAELWRIRVVTFKPYFTIIQNIFNCFKGFFEKQSPGM